MNEIEIPLSCSSPRVALAISFLLLGDPVDGYWESIG
uniref:Uncharacterized protein n=1 Tax=Arundo donax TaxID=35708 RepID=A0A0A9AN73_ARUDO